MKQEEAAELLDISVMTLRALERDSSKIDYSMILKIEQIYNIPQDYIFFGNNTAFSVILKKKGVIQMSNLVVLKEQQVVTTSLQVAETFEKQHKHVLDSLDELMGVAENSADLFWEDTYIHPQNKQSYRMIFMNRDGFTLLAMGFTGKKALEFKLKYIKAFNDMESHIKQQLDMSNLSPELQLMANLVNNMAKQELAQKQLNDKVDSISEIVALNTTDWRKEANALINKIVRNMGGTAEAHKDTRSAIFEEVNRRAGVSLETRLTNKRRRMADEGASKSKRDGLTKVDVISDDKKLVEIYVAVVKEFAIKYGVYKKEMAK